MLDFSNSSLKLEDKMVALQFHKLLGHLCCHFSQFLHNHYLPMMNSMNFRLLGWLGLTLGHPWKPESEKRRIFRYKMHAKTATGDQKGVPRTAKGPPRRSQVGQNGTEKAPRGAFGSILKQKNDSKIVFFLSLQKKIKSMKINVLPW